jgi:hypothetical protein
MGVITYLPPGAHSQAADDEADSVVASIDQKIIECPVRRRLQAPGSFVAYTL